MIKQLTQSAAYICPVCSSVTCRHFNIFDFSGKKPIKLLCGVKRCKEEAGSIREEKDGYRISVDCPFCGYAHDFNIKKASFWSREFLVFKCPVSEFELFMIGDEERVRDAIKKQQRLLAEMAIDDERTLMLFDMMTAVHEMAHRDAITCECGSEKIEIEICDDKIVIVCSNCGASLVLAPNEEEYERIMAVDKLKLKKKND